MTDTPPPDPTPAEATGDNFIAMETKLTEEAAKTDPHAAPPSNSGSALGTTPDTAPMAQKYMEDLAANKATA